MLLIASIIIFAMALAGGYLTLELNSALARNATQQAPYWPVWSALLMSAVLFGGWYFDL